ncbi:hypothetical protein SUGI_1177910 [Cryptomeria japonica]|nr:hypothetical protein SUGI_1177910 [Cryptomeria japonica]
MLFYTKRNTRGYRKTNNVISEAKVATKSREEQRFSSECAENFNGRSKENAYLSTAGMDQLFLDSLPLEDLSIP